MIYTSEFRPWCDHLSSICSTSSVSSLFTSIILDYWSSSVSIILQFFSLLSFFTWFLMASLTQRTCELKILIHCTGRSFQLSSFACLLLHFHVILQIFRIFIQYEDCTRNAGAFNPILSIDLCSCISVLGEIIIIIIFDYLIII